MIVRAKIELAGETGRGLVRPRNEDNFCLVSRPGDNASLAVVADGVGGRAGGDVASYVCCRILLDAWRARSQREMSVAGARCFLEQTIAAANQRLMTQNRFGHNGSAMATTVVCSVVFADRIVTAHVGDSRLYMSAPGRGLMQLTQDHVLSRLLAARGIRNPSLRDGCRPENMLYQAVGTCRNLKVELQTLERPASARYLWCSDGLSKYVPEDRIVEIMEASDCARAAVDRLMRETLLAGAPDNVTVICGFPDNKAQGPT